MSVCSNCHTAQGPFSRTYSERGIRIIDIPPVCKNTKLEQDRIAKCVARRDKIDYDRYKELQDSWSLDAAS